jgi:hypothetical protein
MVNKLQIPTFANKADLFKWLGENKALLMEQKKATLKEADTIPYFAEPKEASKADATKQMLNGGDMGDSEDEPIEEPLIKASLVINTTNVIDSHLDCHMKGIWKKSLSEKKNFYLLQEHDLTFKGIITDAVSAYTKNISWTKLGAPYEGNTEALMFDVQIDSERNEYMYEQYAKGFVKQHSVGMRYVKIFMCVNSSDKYWAEEKANWDKYYNDVVNKEVADEYGYFFAVTEAKIVEGSAVVLGSNPWTPTMPSTSKDISEPNPDGDHSEKDEPLHSTQTETPIVEQTKSTFLNPNLY